TVWFVGHVVLIYADYADDPERSVRVALIQQNTDPRQASYRQTLSILQRLTHESLAHNPDLVAWSETAFVPNIRRWAAEDPPGALSPIVNDFLSWQRSIGTWLLTGNDDYEVIRDLSGRELDRSSYNAAVLFSDTGERRETYRKIKLVPFTEYFPYRNALPEVYELLQNFDINLWEPGRDRTVFEHPLFRFSTPICFEDVFPNEVRKFVLAGAEVILNITNDYWSLADAQATQHFAAGMFRAVENRRQLLRSTASGLTAHVDPYGRILETLPHFEEAYMVRDVAIADVLPTTIYTTYGDWFVALAGVITLGFFIVSVPADVLRRRRNHG
ncbi:MAG: apolipoprotein N-acyltransferase, partial [bacterium]